jgi:hypothetical protein
MLGGLCAGLERSWIGRTTFAQASNAASPFPLGGAGADSLNGSLVAEHAGDLIVESDLTIVGLVSWMFPFGSDSPRSAPLRVAALRTAETMAAKKMDRSSTELPLCIGLSARVAELGRSTSRPTIQNSAYAVWLLGTWTPPNSKKQASEFTQTARRERRSFGRKSRTHSMPTERPSGSASCYAFLRSCDDQIRIEPLGPRPRASELTSCEPCCFGVLRGRFPWRLYP